MSKIKLVTLEEKLKKIVKEIKTTLSEKGAVRELKQLFLQTLHPEQFCPKCNNQMFIKDSKYECINCGYIPEEKKQTKISPKIPQGVKDLIEKTTKPKPIGAKIQQLANSRGGGGDPQSTQEEIKRMKSADPNISNQPNIIP